MFIFLTCSIKHKITVEYVYFVSASMSTENVMVFLLPHLSIPHDCHILIMRTDVQK
jgi:hypothetical protein